MFALTQDELAPYWVVRSRELILHEGLIRMIAPADTIPTFDIPFPSPKPTKVKGALGWACQDKQVPQCTQWLQARSAKPIGEKDLQVILCTICKPSHVKVKA